MTTRTDYLALIFAAWLLAADDLPAVVDSTFGGLEPHRRASPRGLGRALDYS